MRSKLPVATRAEHFVQEDTGGTAGRPSVDPWSPESPCSLRAPGRTCRPIVDAVAEHRLTAEIVAVVSDRPDAGALIRAERAGIPAIAVPRRRDEPRGDYDRRLADIVAATGPSSWCSPGGCASSRWLPRALPRGRGQPAPGATRRAARGRRDRAGVRRGPRRRAHEHRGDGAPSCPTRASTTARCSPRSTCRSCRPTRWRRSPPASTPPSTPCSSTCSSRSARHHCVPRPRGHVDAHSLTSLARIRRDGMTTHPHCPQRRPVRPLRGPHLRRRRDRAGLVRGTAGRRRHHGDGSPPASPWRSRWSRRRWTRSPRRAWRWRWPATVASA